MRPRRRAVVRRCAAPKAHARARRHSCAYTRSNCAPGAPATGQARLRLRMPGPCGTTPPPERRSLTGQPARGGTRRRPRRGAHGARYDSGATNPCSACHSHRTGRAQQRRVEPNQLRRLAVTDRAEDFDAGPARRGAVSVRGACRNLRSWAIATSARERVAISACERVANSARGRVAVSARGRVVASSRGCAGRCPLHTPTCRLSSRFTSLERSICTMWPAPSSTSTGGAGRRAAGMAGGDDAVLAAPDHQYRLAGLVQPATQAARPAGRR